MENLPIDLEAARDVLGDELFSAVILMVIGTTFIAPPLLKWSFGRWGTAAVPTD